MQGCDRTTGRPRRSAHTPPSPPPPPSTGVTPDEMTALLCSLPPTVEDLYLGFKIPEDALAAVLHHLLSVDASPPPGARAHTLPRLKVLWF